MAARLVAAHADALFEANVVTFHKYYPMASIKVKFRPSTVEGREGTIYYQVIHERKVRHVITSYKIQPSAWSERRSTVVVVPGETSPCVLAGIRESIRFDIERMTRVIRGMEQAGVPYTADEIVERFKKYSKDCSMFNFMQAQIMKLRVRNKVRTAETYMSAMRSFEKFRNGSDIMLDTIDSDTIEAYEAWLEGRGVVPNTVSYYMRILRAVYNRAVDCGLIDQRNPFRHVYTGVDKTMKRALTIQAMSKIKSLDLTMQPSLDYARDMFMMSFYFRGMSFIDMAFLRKTDLDYGYISYRRRKTGQRLVIKWTKEMQAIMNKYPENPTPYLLPIIRKTCNDERSLYRNVGYSINRSLKRIAEMVGVGIPLTLYVARHSWASAARAKGVPLCVISEGMGHDSEATTQIYLATLDTSIIDKANKLIIKSL